MSRSRRWPLRRSRLRRSCGGSRPCSHSPPSQGSQLGCLGEPSTASAGAWAAAGAAARMLHDAPLPPWPGEGVDEIASRLDSECDWLVTNGVLPADIVERNRRIAEAAFRPWKPVFTHGDL